VEKQLERLADTPVDALRADLAAVWQDEPLPPAAREILRDPAGGPQELADALWRYWSVAIEPDWPVMRAVLEDDVAFRAGELTRHGLAGLLAEMHPDLTVDADTLRIEKKRHPNFHQTHDLTSCGMLLIPSIFVWPNLLFAGREGVPASLTYPARGIGNVWGATAPTRDEDALGALLGRSRAAILTSLAIAQTTTELAVRLGQSASSVSQHLAVLSRSGLVVSWRSGRKVLYLRTDLATSVVEASGGAADGRSRRML
jgi:DNA-binding transcriptional ArsR family regulator